MKDRLLAVVASARDRQRALVMREYLQAHILRSIHQAGGFRSLAFVGGTALRFLHQLRRFSEDLDFSLEDAKHWEFERLLKRIEEDGLDAGFAVTVHSKLEKTVQTAFVRFSGLLFEAGVSPLRGQKLSIKLEVDTRPPAGAQLKTTVIDRHFFMTLWHHDLPSLMAGKLHALLTRPYTKGRDLYDLLWYLTRPEPIQPNLTLLNHAMAQSNGKCPQLEISNWKVVLAERLRTFDWKSAARDVAPFLEDTLDLDALKLEHVEKLLQRK